MPPATPIRRCVVRLWTAALAVLISALPARCEEPAAGVVVLRNGNVLEGAVQRQGNFYVVEQGGATLQIPAGQVERACASLVEAYERRRQERVGASADAHLELARWCVRNHLLDQAAREVLDARVRDSGHPQIALVEMQIRQALEIEASRRARAEQEQAEKATQRVPPEKAERHGPLLNPPLEAQTQFVRSIQPMLVQGCAIGGCHHAGAPQRLQLDRWALEGNGNPDLIRQNLESVLSQIDAADPTSSPLIIHARKVHGNARDGQSKPLTSYQSAILLGWLNAAAGVAPAVLEETAPPVDRTQQLLDAPIVESATVKAPASPKPVIFTPRDAFDPEIFNRQVAAEAQHRDATAATAMPAEQEAELDAIGDAVEAAATRPAAE